jgi:cyclopropane fatty-acyl-phospholipid synthase-like methyltransferase
MAGPGLRERFWAWWHGVELSSAPVDVSEAGQQSDDDSAESELGRPNCKLWTPPRMALSQTIFGEGMTSPGGEKSVARLAAGLHLDQNKTLVEYGAALGGVGFTISKKTGCRVIGLEPDQGLAKAANVLAFRRNLENRAAIRHPGDGFSQFKPASIDAVVSKEQFYTMPQKAGLFAQVARVLKPNGQVAFTDIVLGNNPPGEMVRNWIAEEAKIPRPVRVQDIEVLMNSNGLEIERSEDITKEYRDAIIQAFEEYSEKVEAGTIDAKWKAWALAEGNYWQARLNAIGDGSIAVHRFLAKRSSDIRISDFFK